VRFEFTLFLFWTSLAISAAAVVLFVWLMREARETGDGRRETKGPKNGSAP
jgi:hypothetical protein